MLIIAHVCNSSLCFMFECLNRPGCRAAANRPGRPLSVVLFVCLACYVYLLLMLFDSLFVPLSDLYVVCLNSLFCRCSFDSYPQPEYYSTVQLLQGCNDYHYYYHHYIYIYIERERERELDRADEKSAGPTSAAWRTSG